MYRSRGFDLSVVAMLLIANGLMYLLQNTAWSAQIEITFALWPLNVADTNLYGMAAGHFQIWQLVTYAFLHASPLHILLNMYGLWLFGSRMEYAWGSKVFAIYYFFCVVGAGLTQLAVSTYSAEAGAVYPTLGASGGVFGLLLAFGLTYPNERLMLIFPPVILRAKWLVIIFAGIELFFGVTGTAEGIAHFAHLGGMLAGYLLIRYWRRHPPRFR